MTPIIDFHSHILPGADHGSADLEESIRQMAIVTRAEVTAMVATPHFYPNQTTIERFIRRTDAAAQELLSAHVPMPSLYLGAEVLYCDGLEQMPQLEQLCIRGTDVLLLELPMSHWSSQLFQTAEILSKRFTVVLAHIDRYLRKQSEEIQLLLDTGAWAQINASSLSSGKTHKKLKPFLQSGRVVALGSDLHGADTAQYRSFVSAPKKLGDDYPLIMQKSQSLLESAQSLQERFDI